MILTVDAVPYPTTKSAVVEYYNAQLDHYFMTANMKEMADLDNAVHPGWKRTGYSFVAYQWGSADGRGAPVSRFYGLPQFGLDTHFYTASNAELIKFRSSPDFMHWVEEAPGETDGAFQVARPDAATGECQSGTVPVYRLWNGRGDSNHRYTTSLDVRQAMINRGWIPEGYGADAVVMCAVQ